MSRKNKPSMQIIACQIPSPDDELISPFHEYMERYAAPLGNGETDKQRIKREKQIAQIQSTIKHMWEHGGAMNLPPTVEPYKNSRVSVIKIRLTNCLVRIAVYTHKHEILLLAALDKPKRYEKATKNKIDKEIQGFLNEAEKNLDIYLNTYQGINITKQLIAD